MHKYFGSRSTCPALWLALFGMLCSYGVYAEEETKLTIEPVVASAIETLKEHSPTKKSAAFSYTSPLPLPPGTIAEYEGTYQYLEKNKWGGQIISTFNGKKSRTTSVSLCGLIELVAGSEFKFTTEQTVTVPVGPIFFPMGWTVNHSLDSGGTVKSLVIPPNSNYICNPASGDKFSFDVTTERFFSSKTTFGSNRKTSSISSSWSCEASDPTKSDDVPVSGNYLPVQCKASYRESGKEVYIRYAFLPEVGFYFRIGGGNDTSKLEYKSVRIDLNPQ